MKKLFSLFSLFFIYNFSDAAPSSTFYASTQIIYTDTLIVNDSIEHSLIEKVITSNNNIEKETTQQLSEFTRYGFKNLFSQYSYNSSLPYASQVNPAAEIYMQAYLKKHKAQLLEMKGWGLSYFNLIENIFKDYGLPSELKYLAVIESNLKTSATSWVGAAGPWQFMPGTAKEFGLVVNRQQDERRDYFKSTHAAAKLLLKLYSELHDWLLVIAAYNGGIGRIYTAEKKAHSKDFWELQYYLPTESKNHVKKFIATHYIMESSINNAQRFRNNNTDGLSEQEKLLVKRKTISGKYIAAVIAKNLSMEIALFNRYNPGFNQTLAEQGEVELLLPVDKMDVFISNKYSILNECVQLLLSDAPAPSVKNVNPSAKRKKHQ